MQRHPTAWVDQHHDSLAKTLQILGAGDLEGALHNVGMNVLHNASAQKLGTLPHDRREQLTSLLADMGFFAGKPADYDMPDYTLVLATYFDRMVEVFRQVIGKEVICIASSRMRHESVDGSYKKFMRLEQQFQHTEWWRWAGSPQAQVRYDLIGSTYKRPHDSLYGIAALAVLVASDGRCDLNGVVPQDLFDAGLRQPERIQLQGADGAVTILPHKGTERDDLDHWITQMALYRFPLQPGTVVRIVTHAVTTTRIGCLAAQTILRAQPDCHIDIVAAPIPSQHHHDLTTEALAELTLLLALASQSQ